MVDLGQALLHQRRLHSTRSSLAACCKQAIGDCNLQLVCLNQIGLTIYAPMRPVGTSSLLLGFVDLYVGDVHGICIKALDLHQLDALSPCARYTLAAKREVQKLLTLQWRCKLEQ